MINLLVSPKIEVRESAAKGLNDIFAKHIKVGEAELNSVLGYKKISDKLRGHTRPDKGRHISDDVDSEVVDVLVDTVSKNYDVVHRYYELKAKLLELPKIRYFERNILYKGMNKEFSYNDAATLVHETLTNISPDFGEIYKNYLYNGQIDALTKKGKSSGAFCAGGYKNTRGFVLLNYGNKIDDASTIAHEMGHAINDELVKAAQNSLVGDIPLCLAETASTFFEDFILDKLYETLDDEGKLAMMIYRLDNAMNTVFRQVACYKFEQDLHAEFRERGFLSAEDIGKIFVKNMSAYLGSSVDIVPGSENWWLYWSHIRSFFYVYSYTFGFLVSKNLQDLVRKDNQNVEKIKKFLSAGSSKSPKDILLDLDIDITKRDFWENGIGDIRAMLNKCESFAKDLGKI